MAGKTTMGVKLDDLTRARLKALGSARDRSPHYLMREAIAQYLEREEARERERQVTLERWERYQQSGAAIDHDEVMDWVDGQVGGEEDKPCPVTDD